MLVREPEDLMARPRAADDFKTIRIRLEELRREKLPGQPAQTTDTSLAGHRGPCACGGSLFPDECDGSCKAI
jgi:hypothetical protein